MDSTAHRYHDWRFIKLKRKWVYITVCNICFLNYFYAGLQKFYCRETHPMLKIILLHLVQTSLPRLLQKFSDLALLQTFPLFDGKQEACDGCDESELWKTRTLMSLFFEKNRNWKLLIIYMHISLALPYDNSYRTNKAKSPENRRFPLFTVYHFDSWVEKFVTLYFNNACIRSCSFFFYRKINEQFLLNFPGSFLCAYWTKSCKTKEETFWLVLFEENHT